MSNRTLIITGIRGLPACHGGFETFAEYLSIYLVSKGWKVIVYCQSEEYDQVTQVSWKGIELIHIPEKSSGALSTIIFDFHSVIHSLKYRSLVLTLGYNTAIFNLLYRVFGIKNIINMDGIEWKRQKWGRVAKLWFRLNEWFGVKFGNHLIADHPEIKNHLKRLVNPKKITTIAYGAPSLEKWDVGILDTFSLIRKGYYLVIARPEPENSILEIVRAFVKSQSNAKLVVLGKFDYEGNDYHKKILKASNDSVEFPGAIYDKETLSTLRVCCKAYIHGHQVGGTNPSLVEALGAGSAIICHDNIYNRWVADGSAMYFRDDKDLINIFNRLEKDLDLLGKLEQSAHSNHKNRFLWEQILEQYRSLLERFH